MALLARERVSRFPRVVDSVVHVALLSSENLRLLRHDAGIEALDGDRAFVVVILRSRVGLLAAEVQTKRAPSFSVVSGALLLQTTFSCSSLAPIQIERCKLHFPDGTCATPPFPDTIWQVQMQLERTLTSTPYVARVIRTRELLWSKEQRKREGTHIVAVAAGRRARALGEHSPDNAAGETHFPRALGCLNLASYRLGCDSMS